MSLLEEAKDENVLGREVLWEAIARAAEYVQDAAGRRTTTTFLAKVRKFDEDNVRSIARAVEAGDPDWKAILVERQDIVDDVIRRLEELLAAAPNSVSAARRGTQRRIRQ